MAGDWLKFEKSTLEKPEVFEIAGILGLDPDAVVGKLLRVWNWFDDQSRDGHAPVTVLSLLDRYCGVTGFVAAMEKVGWIVIENDRLTLPNFDRHNGSPAKSRALGTKRKQKSRECHGESVTKSGQKEDGSVTREEKRREEKSKLLSVASNEVVDFWNSKSELPKIQAMSAGRVKHLKSRSADSFFAENWKAAIHKLLESPFLTGSNDKAWRADFDWFIKPDSVPRIMEGKYDARESPVKTYSHANGYNESTDISHL